MISIKHFLIFIFLAVNPALYAQSSIVVEHVQIITMENNEILKNRTVLIENSIIKKIGNPNEIDIPSDATIIDAAGKFLLPGFINMYTHVSKESLVLYLANGQTTVRDAPSHIAVLGLRDDVKSGKLLGPQIFSIGLRATGLPAPYHSQQPTTTPEEGRKQVSEAIRLGYDGMMIYATCSPATYDAIMDEAQKHNFPISGHWPMYVDQQKVISGTQATFDNFSGLTRGGNLRVDEEFLINGLKRHEKAVVPTISIHRLWAMDHLDAEIYNKLPLKYVPAKMKASWIPDGDPSEPSTYNYKNVERLIKRMHNEDIQLFIGSDGGYPMAVHGFSFHDELQAFVDAGISEYHTLRYATTDPASYLGLTNTGLIKEGFEADLVLLGGNPLSDISNTKLIEGVVLNGKWLSNDFLDKKLKDLEDQLSSTKDRFENWKNYLKPDEGSKENHYSYKSHGQEIGEEKIILDHSSDRNFTIRSVSIVDGPDFRETYSFFRVRDRQLDSLSVIVKGADGTSNISAYRKDREVVVEGEAPFHGNFSYQEPFLPGMLLLGPFTSRYFDIDIVANYQVALLLSKRLNSGEADQLPSVQIEMNSEEFGKKYIVDTFDLTIYKNDDSENHQLYTFIHPGFSGFRSLTQPSFALKAEVKDQMIQTMKYQNYSVEILNQTPNQKTK